MDRWWDRFDPVIRDWIRNDPESMAAWQDYERTRDTSILQRMARRGQIGADAPMQAAVWEAFLYQRAHSDAFLQALTPIANWRDNPPDSLGIIDLGCGAGTVAVALDEFFDHSVPLHYRGIDHHDASHELCRSMASDLLTTAGGSCDVHHLGEPSLPDLAETLVDAQCIFVTMGYLLCQDSLSDHDVAQIAASILAAVDVAGKLRVVVADAPWWRCRAPYLTQLLRDGAKSIREFPADARPFVTRFPALDGSTFRSTRSSSVQTHYLVLER